LKDNDERLNNNDDDFNEDEQDNKGKKLYKWEISSASCRIS